MLARFKLLQIILYILIVAFLSTLSQANDLTTNSRKLDENPPDDNRCGNCPCSNPCNPPPSPPLLPPPPPPSPPLPPQNPSPSNNCPPPPPPSGKNPPVNTPSPPYMYLNGPPGNVYQVYPYYSGQDKSFSVGTVFIPLLIISCAVLGGLLLN